MEANGNLGVSPVQLEEGFLPVRFGPTFLPRSFPFLYC